jgi:hypothetical protein
MKLFECQHCGQPLFFENTRCEKCGHALGYLPDRQTMTALEPAGDAWRALAAPQGRWRSCANAEYDVCNWLVAADVPARFCIACRHNRTIPNLSRAENLANWRKIEVAKRRLFYSILRLQLPLTTRPQDPQGLVFDFLADENGKRVMTGHENGLITLNLAEADDPERERRRSLMGEPYRTLLGHFRHEIAHYYWNKLIAGSAHLPRFREVFGDERVDYGEALKRHYAEGALPDWRQRFVTSYASSHPWEDFAESWAHYFHMIDTLDTAEAFGLRVRPQLPKAGPALAADIDFDPYEAPLARVVEAWIPLTFAVNSINRSMGLPDLYPFVLAPAVIEKLGFVHEVIRRAHRPG